MGILQSNRGTPAIPTAAERKGGFVLGVGWKRLGAKTRVAVFRGTVPPVTIEKGHHESTRLNQRRIDFNYCVFTEMQQN